MLRFLFILTAAAVLSACDFLPKEWFEKEVTTNVIGDGYIHPEGAVVKRGESFDFLVVENYNSKISMVSGCGGVLSESTYTITDVKDDCVVQAFFEYKEPPKSLTLSANRIGGKAWLSVHNRWNNIKIEQIFIEGLLYRSVDNKRYRVDDFVINFRNIPGGDSASSRLPKLRSRDIEIEITRISSCRFSIYSPSDCTDLAVAADIDEKLSRVMLPITISKRE